MVVKALISYLKSSQLSKQSRSLLHALFKWDQQQELEFEVELLRRKTAALLTTPASQDPITTKTQQPYLQSSVSPTLSVYLTRSLFPHPP